jgi:hypothetical protein
VLGFCQIERSDNTSGMPGVHLLTSIAQPKGFWQARIKLADGNHAHQELLGAVACVSDRHIQATSESA